MLLWLLPRRIAVHGPQQKCCDSCSDESNLMQLSAAVQRWLAAIWGCAGLHLYTAAVGPV